MTLGSCGHLKSLSECSIYFIAQNTKIFVNGDWVGVIEFPVDMVKKLKNYRIIQKLQNSKRKNFY